MERPRRFIGIFVLAAILWGMTSVPRVSAGELSYLAEQAQPEDEPMPRTTTLIVDTVEYEWWLLRWSDNTIVCQVIVEHEGMPTNDEILQDCGQNVYAEWQSTTACTFTPDEMGNVPLCPGLYFMFINSGAVQKSIEVELPPPSVEVSLSGCNPSFPENRCSVIPNLLLTGIEPLPNERIIEIHAIVNGIEYICYDSICEVPLDVTPISGQEIQFWAISSFGDSSEQFTAQVRIIESGVSASPGYYVDVLSSQWRGRDIATCAQTWGAFPPVGGPPLWLTTPEVPELLASDIPYYFLAGRLIAQGLVDANQCPGGGLLPNGYADECGLEKALPAVLEWQNQFDTRIIEVARETGVPAQLLKNLFAQESQFWPGVFNSEHLGLGHITPKGVEVVLLWNQSFFQQFCPLVLDEGVCSNGYAQLDPAYQSILRGALASKARTDCLDCPAGIDLTSANASIDLFAQTLLANCDQVAQEVFNATKSTPGAVSEYEDLWKFTLANYHAGPGCLSYALYTSWNRGRILDWEAVSQNFTPVCQGVVFYVDQIAK